MAQQTIQIADKPTLNNVNETTLSMLQMLSSYDCEVSTLPYDFEGGSAVVLDGVIHILSGFGNNRAHYRYDGPKYGWVSISTLPDDLVYTAVVFEGKIHIFSGTTHYRYDGAEYDWVSVSTLPYDVTKGSVVVLNGEIHILGGFGDNTAHYKWNGTEWSEVSTLPYKLTYYYEYNPAIILTCYGSAVVLDGEIHILGGFEKVSQGAITIAKHHYKWNGTEWVEISTLPVGYSEYSAVVFNNEIHILCGEVRYKWNGTEWSKDLTKLPCTVSKSLAVVLDNEIHILGGEYNSNSHHALVLNTSSLNDIYTLLSNIHKNIDTLDVGGDNTEVLSQLEDIASLLEDGTYGLNALKNLQDTYDGYNVARFEAVQNSISSHDKNNYDRWADLRNVISTHVTDEGLRYSNIIDNSYYGLNAIANWCNRHESSDGARYNDLVNRIASVGGSPRYKLANFYSIPSSTSYEKSFTYDFAGTGKVKLYGLTTAGTISISATIDGVYSSFEFTSSGGYDPRYVELEYDSSLSITFNVFSETSVKMWHYTYAR